MDSEVKLDPVQILNTKFTKGVKGYNADEVDEFLDVIIKDYYAFQQYSMKSIAYITNLDEKMKAMQATIDSHNQEVAKLQSRIRSLEAENVSWKNRFGNIKSDDHVTPENLDYINKINAYEEFLLSHGYNLNDIVRGKK